jgi:hypothetical protein
MRSQSPPRGGAIRVYAAQSTKHSARSSIGSIAIDLMDVEACRIQKSEVDIDAKAIVVER